MPTRSANKAIVRGWLIAGTLDISDALIFYGLRGVKAERILQSVASGLLGTASFRGGWKTAALGLALHFLIALIWTVIYYAASRVIPVLRRQAVVCGLIYGLFVYAVMNYIVVPLSAVPKGRAATGIALVNAVLAIVLFIGLPIALATKRWGRA